MSEERLPLPQPTPAVMLVPYLWETHSFEGIDGQNPFFHLSSMNRLHKAPRIIFNKGLGLEWGLKS